MGVEGGVGERFRVVQSTHTSRSSSSGFSLLHARPAAAVSQQPVAIGIFLKKGPAVLYTEHISPFLDQPKEGGFQREG